MVFGQRFARNALLNLSGQVAVLAAGFIVVPHLVRQLGVDRFGVLALAWVVFSYFGLFDLGLSRATLKLVADALSEGRSQAVPELVWTSASALTALGLVGAMILSALTPTGIDQVLRVPGGLAADTRHALYVLSSSLPLILLTGAFRAVLEAQERFDVVNAVVVPTQAATFFLPLIGGALGMTLTQLVGLIAASRALAAVAFIALALRSVPLLRTHRPVRGRSLSRLLSFGGWVAAAAVISPLIVYLDRFLIAARLEIADLSYYAAPYEGAVRLLMVPASIAIAAFPVFSASSGAEGKGRASAVYVRSLKYLLMALGPVVTVAVVYAPELLRAWLGPEFADRSTPAFRILVAGVLVNGMAGIAYALLQGVGRPDLPVKFYVAEFPFYLAVAWWLIGWAGITGAAIAWGLRVTADAVLLLSTASRWRAAADPASMSTGLLPAIVLLAILGATAAVFRMLASDLAWSLGATAILFLGLAVVAWHRVLDPFERRGLQKILQGRLAIDSP